MFTLSPFIFKPNESLEALHGYFIYVHPKFQYYALIGGGEWGSTKPHFSNISAAPWNWPEIREHH
jgi:hypothetical protein